MDELPTSKTALAGGHHLEIARSEEMDTLLVQGDSGAKLRLRVDAQGIHLELDGVDLTIHTRGNLELRADSLHLHGERALAFSTSGDATITAGGDLDIVADAQRLRAVRGNVEVQANDDVRVDGERIYLNS